jgi:hypothetical protein
MTGRMRYQFTKPTKKIPRISPGIRNAEPGLDRDRQTPSSFALMRASLPLSRLAFACQLCSVPGKPHLHAPELAPINDRHIRGYTTEGN